MEIAELAFPVTLESFVKYQESLIGRDMDENECAAIDAWCPILNRAYAQGLEGDAASLRDSMVVMDRLLCDCEGDLTQMRFLKASRLWAVYAWEQGRRQGSKAEVKA